MLVGDAIPEAELTVTRLTRGFDVASFDCGDADLNEFLKNDSFKHDANGVAKTFVCLYQNKPVGFFSICADAIRLSQDEKISSFGEIKPYADYPAIKIARLGVDKNFQSKSIGSFMVSLIIGKAIALSRDVGCRFVTVDAYAQQVGFYKKCRFIENLGDKTKRNVSMRLDLIAYMKQ